MGTVMARHLGVDDLLRLPAAKRRRILAQLPGRLATGSDVLAVSVTVGGRVVAVRHYARNEDQTLCRDPDGNGVKTWTQIGDD